MKKFHVHWFFSLGGLVKSLKMIESRHSEVIFRQTTINSIFFNGKTQSLRVG